MTQYELIPLISHTTTASVKSYVLPELVHESDPALSVMNSFHNGCTIHIGIDAPLQTAAQELKTHNAHVLLVTDNDHNVAGVVTSEDILGEKPIQLLQQSRLQRNEITVKMLMTPLSDIISLNLKDIEHARVGNVVSTLKHHHQHFALVVSLDTDNTTPILQGLFNTSQISKQLHTDIEHSIQQNTSVSALKKNLEPD